MITLHTGCAYVRFILGQPLFDKLYVIAYAVNHRIELGIALLDLDKFNQIRSTTAPDHPIVRMSTDLNKSNPFIIEAKL